MSDALVGLHGFDVEIRDAPELILTHRAVSSSNATTYTFSNVNIGDPAPDRLIVVLAYITEADASAGDIPTSVSIDGVNGTIHVTGVGTGSNSTSVSVVSRLVTAGTSIAIVITAPDAQVRAAIAVYTLRKYTSATPTATQGAQVGASTNISVTLDVPPNRIGIAGCNSNNNSNPATWTNANKEDDTLIESPSAFMSSAVLKPGTGNVIRTCTWATSGELAIAGAVWG